MAERRIAPKGMVRNLSTCVAVGSALLAAGWGLSELGREQEKVPIYISKGVKNSEDITSGDQDPLGKAFVVTEGQTVVCGFRRLAVMSDEMQTERVFAMANGEKLVLCEGASEDWPIEVISNK